MALKDALIAELKHEALSTRKILERIPGEQFEWRPHPKSMSLGRLAAHVAELPVWVNRIFAGDNFDLATVPFPGKTYSSTAELLQVFEEKQAGAIMALQESSEAQMEESFSLQKGGHTVFALSRKILLRSLTFNHMFHHRGQLSVYLRLLDIPVPGMYGPSADER